MSFESIHICLWRLIRSERCAPALGAVRRLRVPTFCVVLPGQRLRRATSAGGGPFSRGGHVTITVTTLSVVALIVALVALVVALRR